MHTNCGLSVLMIKVAMKIFLIINSVVEGTVRFAFKNCFVIVYEFVEIFCSK